MPEITTQSLAQMLALVGVVIIVAALLSGLIERTNLPQVAAFLALGAALGPAGLQLMEIGLQSSALRVVATLSLALVLFTDAVSLNIAQIRSRAGLALRLLGPGTLLTAAVVALAGWLLLGLPPAGAVILGAALASTDPVLLRGLLRGGSLPEDARQALRVESGLNDAVLLPIVLVAMAFLTHDGAAVPWARMAMNLFVLGPGAGIAVGLLAVSTLDFVRKRFGVRRDYESLYSLGVAFAAFAAAESLHGSGFLAVFAAGLVISWLDVELCDCFLEYGETTAEMALLFAFVLLGSSLIWTGLHHLTLAAIAFTAIVILARPATFLLSLARSGVDQRSRYLIAWFGPRGLSSLLLVLLPVFEKSPGSRLLFELCCLVVLASVLLHGGTTLLVNRGRDSTPSPDSPSETAVKGEGETRAPAQPGREVTREGIDAERITIQAMQRLARAGEPLVLVDSRSERTLAENSALAGGAIRIHPEHAVRDALRLKPPRDAWLAVFCA